MRTILGGTLVVSLLASHQLCAQSTIDSATTRGRGLQLAPLVREDTTKRPRAVDYSDLYYKRLKVHQIGAIAMLPLAGAQYLLGDQLLNKSDPPGWVKGTHSTVAVGLDVIFGVNTITGAWNLWDSRHDSNGRARRYLHSGLMVASDVAFLMAVTSAGSADDSHDKGSDHRTYALTGLGLATVSTVMMWLWKD